jgi:hypothetical protein
MPLAGAPGGALILIGTVKRRSAIVTQPPLLAVNAEKGHVA